MLCSTKGISNQTLDPTPQGGLCGLGSIFITEVHGVHFSQEMLRLILCLKVGLGPINNISYHDMQLHKWEE